MNATTVVVVNPASRNGATGRRWREVARRVREQLGEVGVETTRAPRDAERIAREAVLAGAERILVAGGDGTASEVVAGVLGEGLGERVEIGFLPLGTGGDLGRTLGTPRGLAGALARIAAGKGRRIDAGRLRYETADGESRTTHFVNVASAGLSGFVDRLVNEAPKALGGTASFLIGTLRGLARYENVVCSVEVDGERIHEGPLVLATAANGRFFGGGMHVAPRARCDDGLLDAVVIGGAPKLRLLARMGKLYRGSHLEETDVTFRQGRRIEVASERDFFLDVDGECVPARSATFEVLPAALRVISEADTL